MKVKILKRQIWKKNATKILFQKSFWKVFLGVIFEKKTPPPPSFQLFFTEVHAAHTVGTPRRTRSDSTTLQSTERKAPNRPLNNA